jgi:Domain of unknown function (DUF4419)
MIDQEAADTDEDIDVSNYNVVHIQNLPRLRPRGYFAKYGDTRKRDIANKVVMTAGLFDKGVEPQDINVIMCKANCDENGLKMKSYGNGFIGAFLEAYNYHGDVLLVPDDVWMVIMMFFSSYVNDNSEALRNMLVHHDGKKKTSYKRAFSQQR